MDRSVTFVGGFEQNAFAVSVNGDSTLLWYNGTRKTFAGIHDAFDRRKAVLRWDWKEGAIERCREIPFICANGVVHGHEEDAGTAFKEASKGNTRHGSKGD